MSKPKSMIHSNLDLNNPQIVESIKRLLELIATDSENRFAKLDEAQNPSQKFLRETEFII